MMEVTLHSYHALQLSVIKTRYWHNIRGTCELCRWFLGTQQKCPVAWFAQLWKNTSKSIWQTAVKNANKTFAYCSIFDASNSTRLHILFFTHVCSLCCFTTDLQVLTPCLLLLPLFSGPALHASCRSPPRNPTQPDSSHANAAQHHPNGPPAATRLPAHRRGHHGVLLLANRHHCDLQSRAG